MSSPPPATAPPLEIPPSPPSPVVLLLPPPGSVTEPLTTAVEKPSSSSRSTLLALGIGIGIGGAIVLVCVGILVIWLRKRKRKLAYLPSKSQKEDHFHGSQHHWQQIAPPCYPLNNHTSPLDKTDGNSSLAKTIFAYEELVLATNSFAESNLLGQGGFGYVHKGVLYDGKQVAIKQLKVGSGQGEREFQAEVDIISRVSHNNLVGLVGYCISGIRRLLVYEYVPNRTLEYHLHGKKKPSIDWATRMKIAIGSAKGLAYLHEDCRPKIVHRDIKSANILLDENFEAKVADFGLARFYSDTDTHVSTRVMGTFGYLAPEYALTGKLTDKSDVFSYGVVLLELITGRRPIDKSQNYLDDNIIDWARPLLTQALEDDNFDILADPRLQKDYNRVEMSRMVACASACVRHFARRRPRMSQIALALEGNLPLDDLNKGIRSEHSAIYGSHDSSDFDLSYDTTQYKEDLMKFKRMALESSDQNTTTEHSAVTIELASQSSEPSVEILQAANQEPQPSANH